MNVIRTQTDGTKHLETLLKVSFCYTFAPGTYEIENFQTTS